MDYKSINNLLERYFEGETSLEEERLLRTYFTEEKVDDRLMSYKSIFRYFDQESKKVSTEPFDEELLEGGTTSRPILLKAFVWYSRVAAAIVIAIGLWWLIPTTPVEQAQTAIDWSRYEVDTPEEAFQISKSALVQLSVKLNEGALTAAKEMTKVQEATKWVQE